MGKRNYYKYGDARILFKKSNSICTQSRTCSGTSQFYAKSGIVQYKNLSQTNDYYIESGKIKRDLSIETDVCILRRYYKSRRNKYIRDGSNKKYSNVISKDTVKECRHGASGDSRNNSKVALQADIATILVENLKGLLTSWIQTHLLENKDTQDKIETVLHSILHNGNEPKLAKVSSRSTYILSREGHDYEVKNKKVETAAFICDYCKHKSRPIVARSSSNTQDISLESQSVPSPEKKLRVLSTLSIPRKKNVVKMKSRYKIRKIKQHKSIHNPRKLLDCSSFDLLAISTRSFTKRCTNYGVKKNKKRRIAFNSKPAHKNISNTTETEYKEEARRCKEVNKSELEDMPSLVKSIYADHPANFSHQNDVDNITNDIIVEKNKLIQNLCKNDKYTITSFTNILNNIDKNKPMIDFLKNSVEFPAERDVKEKRKPFDINSRKNYLTRKRRSLKIARSRTSHNKSLMMSQKECENSSINDYELLNHIKSILEYIKNDSDNKNLKLDIHVSLMPAKGKSVDASSYISNPAIGNNIGDPPTVVNNIPSLTDMPDEKQSTTINSIDTTEKSPEIIPLLDGAASQAKYIFNTENTVKCQPIKIEDQATKASKLEMVQEIHDLKSVVKNLLHTAETLVSEQIKKESDKRKMIPHVSNIGIKTAEIVKPPSKPLSQGIQLSNDSGKNLLLAGIKLSKEPKKDTIEFCHRLMRKSTSYKIIASESVLRVTDMTVGGKTDPPETDNIPKSKSLIDVTEDKKNVIAYYCDGGCNSESNCRQKSVSFYKISSDKCIKSQKENSQSYCECSKNPLIRPVLHDSEIPKCLTSDIDVENCCDKKALIPPRKGMGFGEGFIYCLLLWIPVTIIAFLFYNYVIKDLIRPSEHKVIGLTENKPTLNIKLSDLGF